jgi:hypothetical protein
MFSLAADDAAGKIYFLRGSQIFAAMDVGRDL